MRKASEGVVISGDNKKSKGAEIFRFQPLLICWIFFSLLLKVVKLRKKRLIFAIFGN
jgi:hypothetical protein